MAAYDRPDPGRPYGFAQDQDQGPWPPLVDVDNGSVVRVERYEAVVLEPAERRERCACGRPWPGSMQPGTFVTGRPALAAGTGGTAMGEVWSVLRTVEALAVRCVSWLLLTGARHPRVALWGAGLWLVVVAVGS